MTHLTAVLSTADGVASDAEVVPVAAAGNAVVNARSSATLRYLRSWWTRRDAAAERHVRANAVTRGA